MSYVRRTLTDAAIGVGIADDRASLSVLNKPGCAAAIWRRKIPSDAASWLKSLPPEMLPRGRIKVQSEAVGQAVRYLGQIADTPEGDGLAWLQSDIADLAHMFADVLSVGVLRLRLDAVSGNACSRFHIDAVTARLVCTYRGPGTQYGISRDGDAPRRVFQVATGAPILLRGTLWPEGPPSGLVHRSPPTSGTGDTRLVLVVDPVFETTEAP